MKLLKSPRLRLVLLVLVLGLTLGVFGATTALADHQVLAKDIGVTASPDVAYNPAFDEYFVVWYNNNRIWGQRLFAGSASPILSRPLPLASAGSNAQPSIEYNPHQNEYLVVYTAQNGIQALRIDSRGSVISRPFTIAFGAKPNTSTGLAFHPADDPDRDTYLVVYNQGPCSLGIWLGPLGYVVTGLPFKITCEITDIHAHPTLAWNPTTNEFLVMMNSQAQLMGCRLDPFGRLIEAFVLNNQGNTSPQRSDRGRGLFASGSRS